MKFKYRDYVQVINDEFYEGVTGSVVSYSVLTGEFIVQFSDGRERYFHGDKLSKGPVFVSTPPENCIGVKV